MRTAEARCQRLTASPSRVYFSGATGSRRPRRTDRVLHSPPKMFQAGAGILADTNWADIKTAFKPGPGNV
jgi:hypothetical protein